MSKKAKKLYISFLCVLIAVAAVAAAAVLNSSDTKLALNGMKLICNGDTTQTFINIQIKNVDASAVAFCLKYDTDYLSLSDADTNEAISPPSTGYDYSHKYFKQNTDDFPNANAFLDQGSIMGQADVQNGYVMMYFIPNSTSEEGNIGTIETGGETHTVIKASGKTLALGGISFNVIAPKNLARLSEEDLKKVIQIVPFSNIGDIVSWVDEDEDTGVYVSYYDDAGETRFYSANETELSITAELKSVDVDEPEKSVSALDIYSNGDISDMIAYLNSYMSDLTLEYADGTRLTDVFLWDSTDNSFKCDSDWNTKGGKYEISQDYNDNITLSVNLEVIPVTLEGFYIDDEICTYESSNQLTTPESINLPDVAHAILSPSSTIKGLEDVAVSEWYYNDELLNEELPDDFSSDGSHVLVAYIDGAEVKELAPWLTVKETKYKVSATRIVVSDGSPNQFEASAVYENKEFKITVKRIDENAGFSNSARFIIRLQDGSVIDVDKLDENSYKTEYNEEDSSVTITISNLDLENEYQSLLAQKLNLGSRLGNFSIAVVENDIQSEFVDFSCSAYKNIYTESNYSFDYSDLLDVQLFRIGQDENGGEQLSNTITLPGTDRVQTTYNGYDGSEPGGLKTVKVTAWTITKDENTVTAVGVLANTEYSNYGLVQNENNSTITITYRASSNVTSERIALIEDFVFDTQKSGYDYGQLQTESFTIENLGSCDINGLSVQIETDSEGTECFALVNPPASILKQDSKVVFSIMTKKNLEIGEHKATVTISSNQTELDTFVISFTVTKEDVFNVTLKSTNETMGNVKTKSGLYTAEVGDTINIIAEPAEDCEFVSWEITQIGEEINLEFITNLQETSFVMPRCDIEITATFKETKAAYLRLEELNSLNPDDSENRLYDSEWKTIEFDPTVREYYVSVSNDTSKNKLSFKPRAEGAEATITVTHKQGDESEATTVSTSVNDGVYTTDEFDLGEGAVKNALTISMYFEGEPDAIKNYVVYIYRELKIEEMVSFEYGNSAYGLIDKMTEKTENPWSEEDVNKAKVAFENNYQFSSKYLPDNANSSVIYTPKAWLNDGVNCDKDDSALFIINNAQDDPVDPGWSKLTNSIGETVEISGVKRSVTVKSLTNQNSSEWGTIEDFAAAEEKQLEIISDDYSTSEGIISGLSELRIRPDTYQLKYTFTDYNGDEITIVKNVVILASLGDVNIDGIVDNTDKEEIIHRFNTLLPSETLDGYSSGGLLYKYRVCDLNKDEYINAIDANTIGTDKIVDFYAK